MPNMIPENDDASKKVTILVKTLQETQKSDYGEFRELLEQACSKIAQRFNLYTSEGRICKSRIINALAGHSCIVCISEKLSGSSTVNDIDALYKECHKTAINILVEELYQLLTLAGYKVIISTEAELEYGKADILITITSYGLNLTGNAKELIVEVKTGNSISLSQLFRYLLDERSDKIIVWRVRKRQILVFNAQKIRPLLTEFMRMICLRANRLLSSQQIQPCHHAKQLNYSPTQEELEKMFEEFSEALVETLPSVTQTILDSLGITLPQCNEKVMCNKDGV
jgi:hypothetical protein